MGTETEHGSAHCPFQVIKDFLQVRPYSRHDREQFFIYLDHSPVKTSQL